jgi:uncharacterized protein
LNSSGLSVEWPESLLLPEYLAQIGWRPVPIRQFLFKVQTRCNLNCDYCYVYEMADQSWRDKPMAMSDVVIDAAAARIAEHAIAHDLDEVRIIFHGGEPLLGGPRVLSRIRSAVSSALPDQVRVGFGMQSNGALLNDAAVATCVAENISVGISLDGDRIANDRHRLFRNGNSSYDDVVAAIERLRTSARPELFTGILCTIDLANPPVETYEHFLSLGAPAVDFLLPHGNWTEPPPYWQGNGATPYADWLIPIFDRWFGAPRREARVRFFEEIINLVLGGHSQVETIGVTPATLVVIEGDGTIEQVDALKSAFDGAANTGLSVFSHSFDEALALPGMAARQIGVNALSDTCKSCSLSEVCGGGYYPHRYREGAGFLNPSVYCADLMKLITHIDHEVETATDRLAAGRR